MLALIPAADHHLMSGQMVAGKVDLEAGVGGIGRIGEAVDHFLQCLHRLFGALLIALHVGDLLVIAEGAQVIGIGDVAMRRMQLDEMVQRADRVRVFILLILGIARHQLRVHRPGGIRVILFHPVELRHGGGVFLLVQRVEGVVVDLLDGRDVGTGQRLGLVIVGTGTRAEQRQQQQGRDRAGSCAGLHPGGKTIAAMPACRSKGAAWGVHVIRFHRDRL